MRRTLEERLHARLDKSVGPDGCWVWTGSTTRGEFGYGQIGEVKDGRRRCWLTHRLAMSLHLGRDLAAEECVLHRCDNPPCCNPTHLFLGDRNDNAKDKVAKGRQRNGIVPGERHGMSKMTDDDVRELRRSYAAHEASQPELAKRFGITQSSVWAIVHRRTWRHVT